jgi:septal ring factor EnvC (AmiA/AmiB activator)
MDQHLASEAATLKKLEDNLSQLPSLADSQREAMVSINRQLDTSRQSSQQLNSTLGEFRTGLGLLTEATGNTSKALERVSSDATARDDRLAIMLERQGKKFTIFATAATCAAVLAAGAAVAAVILG